MYTMYCTSTAKFDAFQECFHGSPTLYCIALGYNRVSRLQKMFRFQGVYIYMTLYLSSIYSIYDYILCFCAEGLHFSALVVLVFSVHM